MLFKDILILPVLPLHKLLEQNRHFTLQADLDIQYNFISPN